MESKNIRSDLIITIDGPAGSGKSTTAKALAQKLNYIYLDTGAMYRAITLKVIRKGITESRSDEVDNLLLNTGVSLKRKNSSLLVLLDGEDVSDQIRSPEVDIEIGWVCQVPAVRDLLVDMQQKIGRNGGIVAEGRDMGTVVFPDAECKFFLVAGIKERGRRRWLEMNARGINISQDQITADLSRRDKIDSQRKLSPLQKAPDSIEIDTSNLTIQQQTDLIFQKIKGMSLK